MKERSGKQMRVWSLMEQGFHSLANFAMAIFLARELPKESWGAFSLGFALLLFAQGFQRALISIPVATMAHDLDLLSGSLTFWRRLQGRITLCATGALTLAAGLWFLCGGERSVAEALAVSALLAPGYFSLEFWRRVLIQCRDIRGAAAVAGGLLVSVALLMAALSFATAGALVAAAGLCACTLLAGAACRLRAGSLLPAPREKLDWSDQVARLGRWSIMSHIAFSGYNTAIQVMLSLVAGPAAMGVFAAVRNIIQPVNTLIGAVDNLDKPRAARAFAAGGFPELFSSLWRTMSTLALVGGLYLAACAAAGGFLVQIAYQGRYGHSWNEVWLWCLIALAMMAAQPLESGLYVAQRSDALFLNRAISALIGLGAAAVAIPAWGVQGALLGLALGWLSTAFLALLQLKLMARDSEQASRLEGVQG